MDSARFGAVTLILPGSSRQAGCSSPGAGKDLYVAALTVLRILSGGHLWVSECLITYDSGRGCLAVLHSRVSTPEPSKRGAVDRSALACCDEHRPRHNRGDLWYSPVPALRTFPSARHDWLL